MSDEIRSFSQLETEIEKNVVLTESSTLQRSAFSSSLNTRRFKTELVSVEAPDIPTTATTNNKQTIESI